jgi:hypothetical protein
MNLSSASVRDGLAKHHTAKAGATGRCMRLYVDSTVHGLLPVTSAAPVAAITPVLRLHQSLMFARPLFCSGKIAAMGNEHGRTNTR